MMMSLQQSARPTPPPPYVTPQWRPAELRFVAEPNRRWMWILAAVVGVAALVAVGVLMVPSMVGGGSAGAGAPSAAAAYRTWADGPSGQAFAATTGADLTSPAGCAAFAANVARISTDGLPAVAVAPMTAVIAALQDMATACTAGDQAATARAAGAFMVAVGALSNTPGIGG